MAQKIIPCGGWYIDENTLSFDENKVLSAIGGGGAAGVASFNGRTGTVVPQDGDYTAEQVGALPVSGGTMTGNLDMGGNNVDNVSYVKAAGTYKNAGIQFNSNGTIINFVAGNSTALELSANNVNVVNHGIDNVGELNMTTNGNITRAGLVGGNVNQNNKTCVDFTTTNSVGVWAEGSERVIIDTNGVSVENNKITNLADPTEDTDSVNKRYVDTVVSGVQTNIDTISGTVDDILDGTESLPYLPDNGGTLTGVLNMGNNKITMGATPTETTDVTNKGYVDGVVKVVSDEVDGILTGTTPVAIPVATETHVGGIKPGAGTAVSGDGTLSIIVPVPTAEDEGKILVVESGQYVLKTLTEIQG